MTKPRPSEDGKRIIFQDPERCRGCGVKGRVVESRRGKGYRKRRRQCFACQITWTTYESLINVQRAMARKRREVLADDRSSSAVVSPPATNQPKPPIPSQPRRGRAAHSRYLTG